MRGRTAQIVARLHAQQRIALTRGFRLVLVALLGINILNESVSADERLGLYRMLLSDEQSMFEAVRRLNVNELLTIHNETIRAAGDGEWFNRTSAPGCADAYIHLALAALAYAVAIEPERSQPVKPSSENAAWGDRIWADYLGYMASCENALEIAPLP